MQELIVLSLRQCLYLPLDDLFHITREYINAVVSYTGFARLLERGGMSRLEYIIPKAKDDTLSPKKTFNDYEPSFVGIDIKYLPQKPDETSRRYLVLIIDRATRWMFLHVYGGNVSDGTRTHALLRGDETAALSDAVYQGAASIPKMLAKRWLGMWP